MIKDKTSTVISNLKLNKASSKINSNAMKKFLYFDY